jgi:hypothetical protein
MPVSAEEEEAFDRQLLTTSEESGEAEATDVIYASSHIGGGGWLEGRTPERARW